MRHSRAAWATVLGIVSVSITLGSLAGCDSLGGGLAALPLARITAVQLFDQPNYTLAFSVESALNNPGLISKINWVFGDGSGFVEGPAGRATITYRYAATGAYAVSAYVFQGDTFVVQINGTANVAANGSGGSGPSADALPGQISGPNPRDEATDVAVKTKLTWTAAADATSHDVYLGKIEADVENGGVNDAVYQGTQTGTSFDPGGLDPETEYFWRIDERNDAGATKGDVLSFKAAKAPKKAKNFVPADGVLTVPVDQVLQWTAGTNATSHDVYFGTDQTEVTDATNDTPDIFKGNQSGTSYDPSDEAAEIVGQLLAATDYYWRIDELGLGGVAKGDTLYFRTADPPPPATDPKPGNGDPDVDVNVNLTWSAVPATTSFDVYFGLDETAVESANLSSPEFKGNQAGKTFDPGELWGATSYYWRIDPLGPGGTRKGDVWEFTTDEPPPQAAVDSPLVHETGVNPDSRLSWLFGPVGGPVTSVDVYLSTDELAVLNGTASALKGNQPAAVTEYDPLGLTPNTQYFWRIDPIGPGGTTTGEVWDFRTGPGEASNPTPADLATGVDPEADLSWTAGAGATSHNVYWGTDKTEVKNDTSPNANESGTSHDPGTLADGETYYWRIDEVGPGGITKGGIWEFTTKPGPAALSINPENGETGVKIDPTPTLTWEAGTGAVLHDVYFGTSHNTVLNATRTSAEYKGWLPEGTEAYTPDPLAGNTNYYWRIDEIDADDNVTKGDVWQFKTGTGPASNPTPTDLETGVDINDDLSWTAGAGAVSHTVYFISEAANALLDPTDRIDAEEPGAAVAKGTQSETTYDPGTLAHNTTYLWRIDEVGPGGTTIGEVWEFTTKIGQAGVLSPGSGDLNVELGPTLGWTAASGAVSHDVYFGTSMSAVLNATTASAEYKAHLSGTSFPSPVSPLAENTNYFWRIDEVDAFDNVTKGPVWSFRTRIGRASSPDPSDGDTTLDLNIVLSWTAGTGAVKHRVYFGDDHDTVENADTTTTPEYKGERTTTTYVPDIVIDPTTPYYWRIDEVSADGASVTKGDVWTFNTP